MILVLLSALMGFQDPAEEGGDLFEWARAIERLDLSLESGDVFVEFGGDLALNVFVFGNDPPPGISVEQAAIRGRDLDRGKTADSPAITGALRTFADIAVGEWLTGSVELRIDHGEPSEQAVGARFEQYWLRAIVPDAPELSLRAGRFAPPLGNFIRRHYPQENPLPTFPLPYDHILALIDLGDDATRILALRDGPDRKHWRVPIWQEAYGHGASVELAEGDLQATLAVMNSAPATWPWQWGWEGGDFRHPNLYGRIQASVGPATRVGLSISSGPWEKKSGDGIPPGVDPGAFPQDILGLDLFLGRGDVEIHAEVMAMRFAAPAVEDLELLTGYVEGRYQVMPGLHAAVRLAQMHFGEIHDVSGNPRHWDYAVTRIEAGGGYAFTANFLLKLSYQVNQQHGGKDPSDNMLSVQVVLGF